MTRRTYIFDPDLDAMVQIRGPETNRYGPSPGVQIIRDIEPYRAVGADVASDGKRPVIGSRTRHRAFLRDNGYVEVGNEAPISGERPRMGSAVDDIRRAMGDFGSRARD